MCCWVDRKYGYLSQPVGRGNQNFTNLKHRKTLGKTVKRGLKANDYDLAGPYVVFEVEYLRNGRVKNDGVNVNRTWLPQL